MITAPDEHALQQAVLEALPEAVLVICREGFVTGFNQHFLDLWKISRGALGPGTRLLLRDLDLAQLKHPEDCTARFSELLADPTLESDDLLEFRDGRVFERCSRPQRVEGKIVGRVFCYRDVTDRMRQEERNRLQAARARLLADASRTFAEARLDFRKITESAVRWAAEFFRDGSLIRVVSGGKGEVETAAFHHVDPDALAVMREILPKDREFIDLLSGAEVLRTGKPVRVAVTPEEARRRLRHDVHAVLEKFPLHSWLSVPLRVAGRVEGMLTVVRFRDAPAYTAEDQDFLQDLADRASIAVDNARLYEAAQRAVQVREDFISIASHELRTPLTPLRSQLEMLRIFLDTGEIKAGAFGERLLRLVADSDGQVCRLAALVEDMLNVSRMKTGRFTVNKESLDLSELVRGVLSRFESELALAKCTLNAEIEDGVFAYLDRIKTEQVLNNLLNNACKYAPGRPVEVKLHTRGESALITVQDHGDGIAEEQQARIFERFERGGSSAQVGGLGLGLFIAREIVSVQGGKLKLVSRPGMGACFEVELPLGLQGRLAA